MLILTRKRNEAIKIGDNIVIKVVQTKSGLVKLGIEAPTDVRVLRAELAEFAPSHVERVETARDTVSDSMSVDQHSFHSYSTDYAAEIEDQLLCVATD